MQFASIIVVCLLCCQAEQRPSAGAAELGNDPQRPSPDEAAEQGREKPGEAAPAALRWREQAAPLVDVAPNRVQDERARSAAELLAAALASPEGADLKGTPATLLELLSPLADRGHQIEVTHAYWELSAAIARYKIGLEEAGRLEEMKGAAATGQDAVDAAQLAAELAAAEAHLNEAELGITAAQHELAQVARLRAGQPLPLPVDVPHAGAYRTYFQEIYAGQAAPPRAFLIDRSLPLLLRSLEARAAVVQASVDAADAALEAWREGRMQLAQVLAATSELSRQRRAFIATARSYNRDIAEYALSIAPPGLAGPELVAMLIKPSSTGAARRQPPAAEQPGGVERAGFNQPLTGDPFNQPRRGPTLAPPRGPGSTDENRPGSQKEGRIEIGDPAADSDTDADADGDESQDEPARQTDSDADPDQSAASAPAQPDQRSSASQGRRALRAPRGNGLAEADTPGLYDALGDLKPARRAQQLASLLHWDRDLPGQDASQLDLAACLSWAAGLDRRVIIESYWQARQRAAEYQLASQRAEQLAGLGSAALRHRQVDGPEAMLRLRAAQLASEADRTDAHVSLAASQFALLVAGRQPLGGPWPLPSTPPHGGSYRLKLEAQPQSLVESPPVQRAANTIPALHELLEQRAAAVVAADRARAHITRQYESSGRSLDRVLQAIRRQSDESLAFLAAQTRYNLGIADYVLAVLSPEKPADVILKALVVSKPHQGAGQR
ncbi:MAG: hypothetical protein WD278_01990 [Pirellulales bacterium]